MFTTRVKRTDLLEILKLNRENHINTFNEAVVNYRQRLLEELEQRIKDVTEGKKVVHIIALPTPEEHTADYDRIIKMLTMSLDDEVTLEEELFEQYVNDVWLWNRAFMANTTSYVTR